MKNATKFLFPLILIAGLIFVNFSAQRVYGQTPPNKPDKVQTVKYTCTMHPEVVQDHPGNCPKCGMKLVEKKHKANGEMHHKNDSTMMKNGHKKMMCDSTSMKQGNMMQDTISMKQGNLMQDSLSSEHIQMNAKQ